MYRDDDGNWREVPLEATDAACLHASLRAVFEFAWQSYSALRTVPANPWLVDEPPKSAWDLSDTGATLRIRGLAPFKFLATRPEASPARSERAPFLLRHFFPLLDAVAVEAWLGTLVKPTTDAPAPWSAPPLGRDQAPFLSTFAPVVFPFFNRMSGWWVPPVESPEGSAWRRAFALAYGIAALSAVPLRSIYEYFHGTAAVEVVEPALDAAGQAAAAALAAPWLGPLAAIDPDLPEIFRTLMSEALKRRARQGCDLYAPALAAPVRTQFTAPPPTTESMAVSSAKWPKLRLARCFEAATVVDYGRLDGEVYWAHEVGWERLMQASDYINQAGFALILNAGNNRWGGRHPPHDTHRNGLDFDLDVAVPFAPGDVGALRAGSAKRGFRRIADLAKLQKVSSPKGVFVDEAGQPFNLVPVQGGKPSAPTSQLTVDRLALWVALQALQLVGMDDVLYGDFENMQSSIRHLQGRLAGTSPMRPVATAGRKLPPRGEPRQLLETTEHYNHLHAECPRKLNVSLSAPPGFTGQSDWEALNALLLGWAEERDRDPRFLALMFGADVLSATSLESVYRSYWLERYKTNGPALLPVWDPSLT